MKSFAILALSAVALAAPVMEKREVVYETVYEQVYETVQTTTTLWVEPTPEPAAAPVSTPAAFYEEPKAVADPAPAPAVSSSAAPAPVVSVAPEVKPVEPAPPAPVVSVAPEVKPVEPAPPAPTTEAAYVPAAPSPSPVAPAPEQAYAPPATEDSESSSDAKGDHTGDITYYDVEVGTGSCGTTASNSDAVVALSKLDMNNGINPNNNPLCGKMINIYYNGEVHQAKVHDTCPVCASGSLDMPESLFQKVAPGGDGRVKGVSWSFA